MASLPVGDLLLELDPEGYLRDPEQWNEHVADALAVTVGVTVLTERHWLVVHALRSYWLEYAAAPAVRQLCRQTRLTLREIYELFPTGPARGACKVAGLPHPNGCV